jgi:hypothetical protein
LLVEIPLVQQAILLLGSPTYAVAAVLCALLVASGTGSLLSPRLQRGGRSLLLALTGAVAIVVLLLPWILEASLGGSALGRLAALAAIVVPLGLLMGMPFPGGIRLLGHLDPSLIPWAWALNGCASVLGSILSVIVALEWGFRTVLTLGGLAYAVAWVALGSVTRSQPRDPVTAASGART